MAKVYTVMYLMDDETATYFPSLPQKMKKDEKEKQEKKNEKMKWKRRKEENNEK